MQPRNQGDAVLLLGQCLSFTGDPFVDAPSSARHIRRGGVLVEAGKIASVDDADVLQLANPLVRTIDHGDHLLMAGFIDAHVHYPQTGIIASWGKRLIDWLETYTFPEEMRFGDAEYAASAAELYLDLALANGTTTAASFCTIHPESVAALFRAAQKRGMCMVAGKTCMDRNAPEGLRDTAQSAYDDSKALIGQWHRVDRLHYAITPRFTPTSSPEQLEALGALWGEHPDCLMQTHLSEQHEEIDWVKQLCPEARDYLDTYERYGLIGKGAIMGHAIHLQPREIDRMAESGTSVGHCPTSNAFIGSGLCDVHGLHSRGVAVGLATDTGGGSSFSMLRTMAAAYDIGQLRGSALHPAALLWLATVGSARALSLEDRIGNLVPGMQADIIALDLESTKVIAQRSTRAEDVWEAIFPTIMMGDERAVSAVYIAGSRKI